jgi:hypothetical protein
VHRYRLDPGAGNGNNVTDNGAVTTNWQLSRTPWASAEAPNARTSMALGTGTSALVAT